MLRCAGKTFLVFLLAQRSNAQRGGVCVNAPTEIHLLLLSLMQQRIAQHSAAQRGVCVNSTLRWDCDCAPR